MIAITCLTLALFKAYSKVVVLYHRKFILSSTQRRFKTHDPRTNTKNCKMADL